MPLGRLAQSTTGYPILIGGALCLAAVQTTQAAGFALIEQSLPGMGTAYASGSAHGEDNTSIFFNPATMSLFDGTHASTGVHIVIAQSEFNDKGSTRAAGLGGSSLGTDDGGDGGTTGVVPHAAYSRQISDDTWLGLTINVPFGLTTEYNDGWVGRYHALKSELMTVNINPMVARKFGDRLTIGAGISAQYLDAELTNAIDYGSIDAALGGPPVTAGPGSADGEGSVAGDSWGWGFNLGLLYAFSERTRLGLQYRSEIDHEVEGDAEFGGGGRSAVSGKIFQGTGTRQFVDTDVKSDLTLPATASVSLYHELTDEWAIMGDYTWTGWDSLDELRFEFDSDQGDSVTTFKWKDTSRVAIGTTYSPAASNWIYRAGIAFDESPIPSAKYRTPRLPGGDRLWFSIGAGYRHSDNLHFDFGYTYVDVDDPEINKTADLGPPPNEDAFRGSLKGDYDANVHILSAQLRYDYY
jgi:long-chain fatty acid transport protein